MSDTMFTDRHWQIYELHFQNRQSFKQAAEVMGVSEQLVKQLFSEVKQAEPAICKRSSTDRADLGRTVGGRHRPKMLSYEPWMDEDVVKQW